MNRIITFAINRDDGIVYSRVGSELAIPVLDYDALGKDGDFTEPMKYDLQKFAVLALNRQEWDRLKWTKKIPVRLKNRHRKFWGMKPLKKRAA